MATLTNTKIKDTYDGLLKTEDNNVLPVSGVALIEDGLGNDSAISIGRANNGVAITGALTASGLSYPTSDGTAGQAIVTDAAGNLSFDTITSPTPNLQEVTDVSPSSTTNTITAKEFIAKGQVANSGIRIWEGNNYIASNLGIGYNTLGAVTVGSNNTMIGGNSGISITTGTFNVAIGNENLSSLTTGSRNMALGANALNFINGDYNTGIGNGAGKAVSGGGNKTLGDKNIYIGADTKSAAQDTDNEIVIGYGAIGNGSNSATYGDSNITKHIFTGGSVGIGTQNPTYPMQLTGAGDTTFGIEAGATSLASLNLGNSTNLADGGIRYDNSTDALIFRANNAEKMRIDSSGNVGINTQTAAGSNGKGLAIYTSDYPRLTFRNSTTGDGATDGTQFAAVGSDFEIYNKEAGALILGTSNLERMRIDSSGNVGIGVTPSSWSFTALQIKNSAFWSTGSDLGVNANSYYDGSAYRYVGNAAASRVYHNTDGSIAWSNAPSGTAGNAITFEERMRIDSSGNVGIGEQSPFSGMGAGYRGIEINGTFPIIKFSNGATDYSQFESDANATYISALGARYLAMFTNGSERMRIDSSGNVGIGVSPSVKLDVYGGSSGVVANFNGVNAYGAETGITLSQGRAKISGFLNTGGATPGSNLRFYTMPNSGSVTEVMRIDSSGNASIGDGGAGARNARLLLQNSGSQGAPQLMLVDSNDSGKQFEMRYDSGVMIFDRWNGSSRQEQMRLNTDNELSINTTSANATLNIGQTGTQRLKAEFGNSNSQGTAQRFTIIRHYPAGTNGNRLDIPFVSQGNLNSNTIVKIWGHSARYNTGQSLGFSAEFCLAHITNITFLQLLHSTGNVASITSSGMTVQINFTNNYLAAGGNGVFVTIEYMTNVLSYSINASGITMN